MESDGCELVVDGAVALGFELVVVDYEVEFLGALFDGELGFAGWMSAAVFRAEDIGKECYRIL